MFSVDNTKNEKRLRYPFFDYINIKWSTWVSYSFKTALDYNYFYDSMNFWCYGTILLYKKLAHRKTEFNLQQDVGDHLSVCVLKLEFVWEKIKIK